jgi:hypothetical protein
MMKMKMKMKMRCLLIVCGMRGKIMGRMGGKGAVKCDAVLNLHFFCATLRSFYLPLVPICSRTGTCLVLFIAEPLVPNEGRLRAGRTRTFRSRPREVVQLRNGI